MAPDLLRARRRDGGPGFGALFTDAGATLDDLREAVNMLEELERAAWRVFGRAHPFVAAFEACLRAARAVLRAREATGDVESIREGVGALNT